MSVPGSERDEPTEGGKVPVVSACVAILVAAGGWVATDATSGVMHVVCGLVTLLAGAYAVFVLSLLMMFFAVRRLFEGYGRVRPEGVPDRIPWFLWIAIPMLIGSWALTAWLSGYDAGEWLWSGISVAAGSVAIVIAFVRRRRDRVPAGPTGPRGGGRTYR